MPDTAAHAPTPPAAATAADVLSTCSWVRRYPHRPQPPASYLRTKRAIDLAGVVVVGLAAAPVVAALALAIKISDLHAPAFHAQERTGENGRRFKLWKLRTMVPDAEEAKEGLAAQNNRTWPDFKLDHDPRVTRIGRVLRRSHLDELPQLWSIARGDMSIVGPRPTSFSADTYDDHHRARLAGLPGLTGLWQISRPRSPSFDDRVLLDVEYLQRRSTRLDLEIMVRTLPVVLFARGDT